MRSLPLSGSIEKKKIKSHNLQKVLAKRTLTIADLSPFSVYVYLKEERERRCDMFAALLQASAIQSPLLVTTTNKSKQTRSLKDDSQMTKKLSERKVRITEHNVTITPGYDSFSISTFCGKVLLRNIASAEGQRSDVDIRKCQLRFIIEMIDDFFLKFRIDRRCSIIALILLHKADHGRIKIYENNIIVRFCAALMIAVKFNDDIYWKNSSWVNQLRIVYLKHHFDKISQRIGTKCNGSSVLKELNFVERDLLGALEFKLMVGMDEIEKFVLSSN